MRIFLLTLSLFFAFSSAQAQQNQPFTYDTSGFYLNGEPFQIWSGELDFQRIPRFYWRDRLLKAKAMGLNTVATCVFWNAIEPKHGRFDFQGNNDLGAFIREAKAVGLYVIVKPGPFVGADWDFGGLPSWLLAKPQIHMCSKDPAFLQPALNYVQKLSEILAPHQIGRGGNLLMLQLDGEYKYIKPEYGRPAAVNKKDYLIALRDAWKENGLNLAFYTSNSLTVDGCIPGAVVGINYDGRAEAYALAKKIRPDVPAFTSQFGTAYPSSWNRVEVLEKVDSAIFMDGLEWLIQHKKSWNLYVLQGGSNFGFYAGAEMGNLTFEPGITSYDFNAPIRENGSLTPRYKAIRNLLHRYGDTLWANPPPPVILMTLGDIGMKPVCSVFDHLPEPVVSQQVKPMEQLGQDYGYILYRTQITGSSKGDLVIAVVHDYANVYLDGKYVASLDRTEMAMTNDRSPRMLTVKLPESDQPVHQLDILVEAMGRLEPASEIYDFKGITESVALNGSSLLNWEIYNLPMDNRYISTLSQCTQNATGNKPGLFFRGELNMASLGDTYLDLSSWEKGVVWVNGHNLGRFWNKGPQQRLYLPGAFMQKGRNEVLIFDLHKTTAGTVKGMMSLD